MPPAVFIDIDISALPEDPANYVATNKKCTRVSNCWRIWLSVPAGSAEDCWKQRSITVSIPGLAVDPSPQIPTLDPYSSHQDHHCQVCRNRHPRRHRSDRLIACHGADQRQSVPEADQASFRVPNNPANCQVPRSHCRAIDQLFRASCRLIALNPSMNCLIAHAGRTTPRL
jgi:hypothetical protein